MARTKQKARKANTEVSKVAAVAPAAEGIRSAVDSNGAADAGAAAAASSAGKPARKRGGSRAVVKRGGRRGGAKRGGRGGARNRGAGGRKQQKEGPSEEDDIDEEDSSSESSESSAESDDDDESLESSAESDEKSSSGDVEPGDVAMPPKQQQQVAPQVAPQEGGAPARLQMSPEFAKRLNEISAKRAEIDAEPVEEHPVPRAEIMKPNPDVPGHRGHLVCSNILPVVATNCFVCQTNRACKLKRVAGFTEARDGSYRVRLRFSNDPHTDSNQPIKALSSYGSVRVRTK